MALSSQRHENRNARNNNGWPHHLEIEQKCVGGGLCLCRCTPFEKIATRHKEAINRTRNRISHQERGMCNKGGAKRHIRRAQCNIGQNRLRMAFERIVHI